MWRTFIQLDHLWLAAMFLVAVGHLFLLRGLDLNIVIVFLLPPLGALQAAADKEADPWVRGLGASFLGLLGAGVVIAEMPGVLPGLGAGQGPMPLVAGRIVTWYGGIYAL